MTVNVNVIETELLLRTFPESGLARADADRLRRSRAAYFIGYSNWGTAAIGNASRRTFVKSGGSEKIV
ncbi:MAG: hypothetical protein CME31_28450 [Gimesia sp.]|uniref:Uncharacterized protein n=1 Tax=Gimesia maris TaxID=122 RepID=A0A3D3QY44_9PLAN|nr:hypothetical protein [Gimesia sp.]HCO21523.1 hypothetical protein [Gimesia maris]